MKRNFHNGFLKSVFHCLAVLACVGTMWLPVTHAYDLPPVNLGFTSFFDGGPPAGPGFYFQQYLQYYSADKFKDSRGDNLPFSGPNLDAFISLTQFIYQSDQPVLLGGKWGVDLIVPVVGFNLDRGTPLRENDPGVGDILVGPFIQWDPVMGKNGPLFMHRIELQTTFPTGRYDRNRELNPGANCFTLNPYWAGTLWFTPKWSVSTRFHYLWSSKNDEPNRAFGPVNTTQAGQAIHFNYATEYEVIPKMLHAGINGYYLKQLTETKVDGRSISGTKEQVFAIGPGAVFHFSANDHIFFNAYFEMAAENRTEGNRFTFRWTHHF